MLRALILYMSGGTYSLKSTPNDRFFLSNFFMAGLFTFRVIARNQMRGSFRRKMFIFSFIREWRDLQFKVDSERQIFLSKFFMAGLFTLRVFARNLLREEIAEKYFFLTDLVYNPGLYV